MTNRNKNRNVRRAVLEALESRQMLSTVSLVDGVLTLAGDANTATALTVTLKSGGINLVAQAGDAKQTYALDQVKRIQAFGGSGDDTITIDQKITLPTWISAGEGNNIVLGGNGDDTIFAGRGTDQIDARGGNNLIMDLDAQGNPVVTSSGNIDAPVLGSAPDSAVVSGRQLPQVQNLAVTYSGRNVTVTADAQQGVDYLVQVQSNATSPLVFACQGSLPVTFALPIADRVFGVIVTPISNGIAGDAVSKVLDVGSVGQAQTPNPVFGNGQNPGTVPTDSVPQVKNLKITHSGRDVTITADAQAGVDYLVQVQSNATSPLVFACQGSLPVTFSLPIADRIFGVIVTPISNGISGDAVAQTLDVGSVGKAQSPNPVFGAQSPSNGNSDSSPTPPTTPTTPTTPPPPLTPPPANNNPTSAQVQAKFTIAGQTGYVGNGVQVDATGSSLGIYDPTTVRYHWDFGDVDSSGKEGEYNQIDGFSAAHAYDKAGTYTVTLTLTDPTGAVSVSRQTVNVLADTRRTIYVASDGNDANNGLSQSSAVRSMARVQQLMGDNTRILFKSGQTFTMDKTLNVINSNVYIGAYGSGSKPRINWTNLGNYFHLGGQNNVIQGLSFDTPSQANSTDENGPTMISVSGTNLVIRDCQVLNAGYFINGNGKPNGILIQDNVAPLATGLTGYFAWCEGSNYTILGNTAANSTREHIVRMENTRAMNISYNDFTNLDRTANGDSNDRSKGTIVIHANAYAWVAHNTIHDGPIGTGPLAIPGYTRSHPEAKADRTTWSVIEANDVYDTSILADQGSLGTVFRNNIVHPSTSNNQAYGFGVSAYNSEYQRGVENLTIVNNTVISNLNTGGFLYVQGSAKGITLDNNLFVDHNLVTGNTGAALVYVAGSDLSSFREIKNNLWDIPTADSYAQGGFFYVWPSWSDSAGYKTPQEWAAYSQVSGDQVQVLTLNQQYAPQGGLHTVSSVAGVLSDFYGQSRSLTSTTVGAVAA